MDVILRLCQRWLSGSWPGRTTRQLVIPVVAASMLTSVTLAEEDKPRFALLVGVSEYPGLSESEQLEGSINDVALMKATLTSRFAFQDDQIQTLTGLDATGDAIRSALKKIVGHIRALPEDSPQAQVVFHFSGHGAQLPDQEDENRDEPDGLDETLVPADATKQGGSADIRDDELNDFAHQVCDDGKAHLWMVLDCCHSGTGTRGVHKTGAPGLTRYRKLSRDVQATSSELPKTVKTLPKGVIALYACRDRELEPEYSDGQNKYGLLTRFLTQVINEQEKLADCTYGVLRDTIAARYRQDRSVSYNAPVPQLEGSSEFFDSAVLGSIGGERKRYWEVRADGTATVLLAGAFHGMTKGSIFEVYDSPERVSLDSPDDISVPTGESIGWIRIERADGSTCKANFISWKNGAPSKQRLPRKFKIGYAIERFHERDDFDLRLKVVLAESESVALKLEDSGMPDKIGDALASIRKQSEFAWLTLVEDDQPSDLVLKVSGDRAALFPSAGKAVLTADEAADPDPLRGGWGPFDLTSPDVVENLQSSIRRITRARNLLRIASLQNSGGKKAIDIKVELRRVPDPGNFRFTTPWPSADEEASRVPAPLEMKTGDIYKYRITNQEKSGDPVYISVLHVNSDMGIEQVFPYQTEQGVQGLAEAKLGPGESRDEGPFACNSSPPHSFGQRTAVVLATRQPNHFYMLKQDSLPKMRAVGDKSSLKELLLQQAYFRTRAARRRPVSLYDNSWGSSTIQWTVLP